MPRKPPPPPTGTSPSVGSHRFPVAESLTALAFLAGWCALTAGVVALTSPLAWVFSLGLLLISAGGWRVFALIAWDGLYVLTREKPVKPKAAHDA